ncbi:hypothetical protein [Leekyejoonella antrihumi]|uniref:ATP synthase subunit I n=1 Tax=Leekyejoonella antrihumi TaxID=1660198 RepID=A0A563E1T7_9MICO|nr:hypothetical protein [Leekyejoonella antrihumi]TWP36510.1 hypothetical protein FGL98_09860 [Leekyejoonella antrihumi]
MSGSPLSRALANQRRMLILGLVLCAAAVWLTAVFGHWQVGVFLVVGILLGMINQVATEVTLLRAVESGEELSRKQYGMSSLIRLMGVSVVAIAVTVIFWSSGGAATLVGLAVFHLITLVATSLPLLKELKKV